jgi:hypothetical protein
VREKNNIKWLADLADKTNKLLALALQFKAEHSLIFA